MQQDPVNVNAAVVPQPEEQVCINKEEADKLAQALREYKNIKESPAKLEMKEPIIIIRDWEDRVYVNGGEKSPIKLRLRIGEYVDREFEAVFPVQVFYREEPPDPPFRLRIKAQAGFLLPQLFTAVKDGGVDSTIDMGIAFDFFHYGPVNINIYTGIRSIGAGLGFDITKNFGVYSGYALSYRGLESGALTGVFFSFN
jgi:hypothetical protein